MSILSEFEEIKQARDKIVKKYALKLYNELVRATPVGNPSIWANPNNKPKGYIGGSLKRDWEIEKVSNGYLLTNNMEYASIRLSPLIEVDGKAIKGSKQFPAGIDGIIQKYDNLIQRELQSI